MSPWDGGYAAALWCALSGRGYCSAYVDSRSAEAAGLDERMAVMFRAAWVYTVAVSRPKRKSG